MKWLACGALALQLLLTGCAGYRVGPVLNAQYRTVAVEMFKNQTLKPQLEAPITNAIIKRFQSDGTLRVVNAGDADLLVTGAVTKQERRELRSVRDDTEIVREYRLTIIAEVQAHNRHTGEAVLKPTLVSGSADTFIGSDLQSAEYQALPLIADDLAKQVVSLLAESW
jgi:hypothetical protein